MRRIVFVLIILTTFSVTVYAQNLVKPEEQARMKPLIAAETKARESLNARVASLPEAKAYNAAKEALTKAVEALNKATEALPENDAWKQAGAKVLDEAYRILAAHALSSREFKPELNAQGDLVFTKVVPPIK